MSRRRKLVKHRAPPTRMLDFPIETYALENILSFLQRSPAFLSEFKRQKRLSKRGQKTLARDSYCNLFRDLDKTNLHYEFSCLVSGYRLRLNHKDTYKQLHRSLILLLERSKKTTQVHEQKITSYHNIELKHLLRLNKSELQIKMLRFLIELREGKTFKDMKCRFTLDEINGLTLKKLLRRLLLL